MAWELGTPVTTACPEMRGWAWTGGTYALTIVLHMVIPPPGGTTSLGYACDNSRQPLLYRNNGLRVAVVVVVLVLAAVQAGMVSAADLARCYWPAARCGFFLGLFSSLLLFLRGKRHLRTGLVDRGSSCLTTAGPRTAASSSSKEFEARSPLEHFYCGYEWNPRVLAVDVKMVNYLLGAVMLCLVVLSALAQHLELEKSPSYAMLAFVVPML
mmetsp:Transcript_21590/g.42735  ORF Transcript_21590/g.42735 Transcript_21590/m.42735 type:complete len:212 (+) Transcript_21590:52-687(+)